MSFNCICDENLLRFGKLKRVSNNPVSPMKYMCSCLRDEPVPESRSNKQVSSRIIVLVWVPFCPLSVWVSHLSTSHIKHKTTSASCGSQGPHESKWKLRGPADSQNYTKTANRAKKNYGRNTYMNKVILYWEWVLSVLLVSVRVLVRLPSAPASLFWFMFCFMLWMFLLFSKKKKKSLMTKLLRSAKLNGSIFLSGVSGDNSRSPELHLNGTTALCLVNICMRGLSEIGMVENAAPYGIVHGFYEAILFPVSPQGSK